MVEAPTRQNNQIARISTPRFGPEPSYVPSLKSGGAARAMGVGVFVINAINFSFQTYAAFTIDNDRRQLMNQTMDRTVLNGLWPAFGHKRWNQEISTLSLVGEDIESAIEIGIITPKIQQNVEQMSQISNRVLFGADIQNDEIRNVADRIINEISTPRYNEVNDNNRIIINRDDK